MELFRTNSGNLQFLRCNLLAKKGLQLILESSGKLGGN